MGPPSREDQRTAPAPPTSMNGVSLHSPPEVTVKPWPWWRFVDMVGLIFPRKIRQHVWEPSLQEFREDVALSWQRHPGIIWRAFLIVVVVPPRTALTAYRTVMAALKGGKGKEP
jgi:hypothetical protein